MDLLFVCVGFLVVAVTTATILVGVFHWLIHPMVNVSNTLNRLGWVIAGCAVIQLYGLVTEIFVSSYGESLLYFPILGKWYTSAQYPWLIYAIGVPPVFLMALFWIPAVRRSAVIAPVLCLILRFPSLINQFFPTDLSGVPPAG